MTPDLIRTLVLSLTETQVSELIDIFRQCIDGAGDAMKTLWTAVSPALIGYVAWRVAVLQRDLLEKGKEREERIIKKIDENTAVSTEAFNVANGHNAKIAQLTEHVAQVASKTTPQQVEVVNNPNHPVPTHET